MMRLMGALPLRKTSANVMVFFSSPRRCLFGAGGRLGLAFLLLVGFNREFWVKKSFGVYH